ncbi:disease resistance protein RUN1-like [Carya illinoinensis]|uniref:disease resistance protein RUN1-like n=1 Tax=Carya illinoinensis TaxID=32201 RepID=UPI001C71BF39|nr:disease resistance protein RUN1-like [Carya illinoinensis]XP_042963708.1 disease resistance protein RUN1-like [Carya illinoinensis]XP_042963709.1 disease resistance protein RUN1-like [Carya illinoinensis]
MSTSSMAFQLGASSSLSFSSSSSSIRRWTHDVFLSFRGTDVRNNFIAHLHYALSRRGINTYIDNNLKKGEEISSELLKAIDGSKISIVVLSKNYSDSRWCLDELLKILECKSTVKQIVLPLFYDVNPSDVRHQKGSFGKAFARLRSAINDEVKVTLWETALKKVGSLAGVVLGDSNEADFILDIITWVDSIMVNRTSLNVAKYPVGMESRVRDIYQHLSLERNDITCMVGICGTGGIGKTTISKEIYNRIFHQFEGSCFLKNIRESSTTGGLIQLQNTLLYKILGENLDVRDCDRGINVISHRLHSKRVLLILDDVDELKQLETLAGDRKWFGPGSRIIVTTRDQHLLNISKFDSTYKMKILADNEARKLFSLHAFEKEEPLDSYAKVFEQVMQYAQGLPLALTVLGSNLKGQTICQWESALVKYKNIPHPNIQRVLQVSYDGLETHEKDMFLDIACFFKGEPLADVIKIFESYDFFPSHGIQRLKEKCLITVEGYGDEYVWMHDLLQDMGREIEREKSTKDPRKRSKLWFHKDVRKVLEEDHKGPNEIEGIVIDLPEGNEEISLHPKAFRRMERLRVFINRNARFSCALKYLSDELRVLDWYNYPLEYLPQKFRGKNLVVFRMRDSIIKELGNVFRPKNLRTMAFCSYLTEIPDLSSTPNLKKLTVIFCNNVVKVHDSIGSLEKLSNLSFFGCSKLQILPRSLKLRSLRKLNLANCSSLRDLSEIECKIEALHTLDLSHTAVEELPLSIGNIVGLKIIVLRNCKNLMRLPIALIQLQYLFHLHFHGVTNFVKKMMRDDGQSLDLPNDSTTMEGNISNSSTALQVSNLQISCSHSESNFFPLYCFFTMFNSSTSLKMLNLGETDIVSLPTSIKGFVTLTWLCLENCHKLEEIAELPPNIVEVDVSGCKSLERFSEVSKILEFNGSHIRSLLHIDMRGCHKMHENIWNDKVQNPLLWKGLYHYDAALFPENQIPDWFRYVHKFLDNEMEKGPDDDARRRGTEEWAIDIEGPHYLEDISGIVLYVVQFFNDARMSNTIIGDVKITNKGSNHVCGVQKGVELANMDWMNEGGTGCDVWVGYSNLQPFEQKVLDNLQVQFCFRAHYPSSNVDPVPFYTSCRAKVVYKNETRANRKRKMDEANVPNSPQQQLT